VKGVDDELVVSVAVLDPRGPGASQAPPPLTSSDPGRPGNRPFAVAARASLPAGRVVCPGLGAPTCAVASAATAAVSFCAHASEALAASATNVPTKSRFVISASP
jgi:hypothetical protein